MWIWCWKARLDERRDDEMRVWGVAGQCTPYSVSYFILVTWTVREPENSAFSFFLCDAVFLAALHGVELLKLCATCAGFTSGQLASSSLLKHRAGRMAGRSEGCRKPGLIKATGIPAQIARTPKTGTNLADVTNHGSGGDLCQILLCSFCISHRALHSFFFRPAQSYKSRHISLSLPVLLPVLFI